MDEFGNSDEEKEPDAYLARVKREAEERDEGEEGTSEDESTDDDFVPGGEASDVAEEYVSIYQFYFACKAIKPKSLLIDLRH